MRAPFGIIITQGYVPELGHDDKKWWTEIHSWPDIQIDSKRHIQVVQADLIFQTRRGYTSRPDKIFVAMVKQMKEDWSI